MTPPEAVLKAIVESYDHDANDVRPLCRLPIWESQPLLMKVESQWVARS